MDPRCLIPKSKILLTLPSVTINVLDIHIIVTKVHKMFNSLRFRNRL